MAVSRSFRLRLDFLFRLASSGSLLREFINASVIDHGHGARKPVHSGAEISLEPVQPKNFAASGGGPPAAPAASSSIIITFTLSIEGQLTPHATYQLPRIVSRAEKTDQNKTKNWPKFRSHESRGENLAESSRSQESRARDSNLESRLATPGHRLIAPTAARRSRVCVVEPQPSGLLRAYAHRRRFCRAIFTQRVPPRLRRCRQPQAP